MKSEVGPVFALRAWGFALRATTPTRRRGKMRKSDARGQRSEDRGQMTDDRGQRTDDRGQKPIVISYWLLVIRVSRSVWVQRAWRKELSAEGMVHGEKKEDRGLRSEDSWWLRIITD